MRDRQQCVRVVKPLGRVNIMVSKSANIEFNARKSGRKTKPIKYFDGITENDPIFNKLFKTINRVNTVQHYM